MRAQGQVTDASTEQYRITCQVAQAQTPWRATQAYPKRNGIPFKRRQTSFGNNWAKVLLMLRLGRRIVERGRQLVKSLNRAPMGLGRASRTRWTKTYGKARLERVRERDWHAISRHSKGCSGNLESLVSPPKVKKLDVANFFQCIGNTNKL